MAVNSFDVIRSNASMVDVADEDLPNPIVSNLKTMYLVDTDVIANSTYYYKVRVWRSDVSFISGQLKAVAKLDFEPELNVSIQPYAFWKLNEENGNFADSSENSNTLIASSTASRGVSSIDPTGQKCTALNNSDTNTSTRLIGLYESNQPVSSNFTVSMWIHMPSSLEQTGGEFFKLDLRTGVGFSIGLSTDSSDNIPPYANGNIAAHSRWLHIGQNSISFRGTNLHFSDDEQNSHIAVRWRNGYLDTFLNGVLKSSRYVGNYVAANRSIGVGRGEDVFRPSFGLKMSRIAVYDGSLTDADILKIANISIVQK